MHGTCMTQCTTAKKIEKGITEPRAPAVIGMALKLFHLGAEIYTQKLRISLSVSGTVVTTGGRLQEGAAGAHLRGGPGHREGHEEPAGH